MSASSTLWAQGDVSTLKMPRVFRPETARAPSAHVSMPQAGWSAHAFSLATRPPPLICGSLWCEPLSSVHTPLPFSSFSSSFIGSLVVFSLQDSENGGDSGCPSEKRSELEDMDHREQVAAFIHLHAMLLLCLS